MLCFIFGAFRTVRTIAQFGSALDWGSRGRGFKSRWSDQESPSFRRSHGIGMAGFLQSGGNRGQCTTDPPCPRGPMAGNSRAIRKRTPSGVAMPEGVHGGAGWVMAWKDTTLSILRVADSEGKFRKPPCGCVDVPYPSHASWWRAGPDHDSAFPPRCAMRPPCRWRSRCASARRRIPRSSGMSKSMDATSTIRAVEGQARKGARCGPQRRASPCAAISDTMTPVRSAASTSGTSP